jgi:hypothetical protein
MRVQKEASSQVIAACVLSGKTRTTCIIEEALPSIGVNDHHEYSINCDLGFNALIRRGAV